MLNIWIAYVVDFIFLCTRKQNFIYIYEKVNKIYFLKHMIIKVSKLI